MFEDFADYVYEKTAHERKEIRKLLEKSEIEISDSMLTFDVVKTKMEAMNEFTNLNPDYAQIALLDVKPF
jgi:hypothetical protein